ncbi:hypothetical protein Tco_0071392 [Tanacetum coccineum]
MAEENVPTNAPTRSDEQILPFNAWLPVGKGNLLLDLQRLQKNPIFRISVDILQNTNFFRAFTASANWFTLNVDLLNKAFEITPVDLAHPFVSPPADEQANLNIPTKKATPYVIPYCQFTKLIIFYLGSEHNIHKRPGSPVHVTGDDFLLGNLKFIPKGEKDEFFGKSIPKELITKAIQNSSCYQQYLEMVARKPTTKEGGQKKTSSKADKPTPVKNPAPAKQTKPVKEKSTKPAPSTKASKGKVLKVQKGKRSDRLVDEEDEEPQPTHEPHIEDDEYNLQRGIQISLESFQAPVSAVAIRKPTSDAKTRADKEKSNSEGDNEILNVDEERGENVSNTVALEERTVKLDEGQTGSDSSNTLESRPLPDEDQARSNPGPSHVALARPNPKPMHEDFIVTVYPKVHEILKHTTEEHVFFENPPSSSGTLSSMKNLDDAFTFGDQFINDKPTEEEPKPVFTATTSTTTTTTLNLLPPPPQQQSTTDPELANRVSALEEICANLVKKNKHQDQTTQALSSRMFMLENHDLYSKIDSYIIETVKESIQNVLQAPVCERFRELSEFEMKEILRDRISSSTSFKRVGPKEEEKHDSDTSGSKQSQAQTSLAWKTSNTREAPSSSSKQRTAPQSEQTVNDVPIPDDVYILDTQDTDAAHLLKIKTKPDWLKPVLEEESPETLKPD